MGGSMNCPSCDHEVFAGQDTCEACGADLTDYSVPEPMQGRLHELILEDPLSQLNAPKPLTLHASDSVGRAVELMRKHRFGSVLVLDDEGQLSGIFTERDLLLKLSEDDSPVNTVELARVMTLVVPL